MSNNALGCSSRLVADCFVTVLLLCFDFKRLLYSFVMEISA